MKEEGSLRIPARRHGLFAALRRKQWWSFEGLDPARKLHFVFLALEGFPSSYVSITVTDYGAGRRFSENHLGGFHAAEGGTVDVSASGAWGHLRLEGRAESGWRASVRTPSIDAEIKQATASGPHRNRLLTSGIDYSILQFPLNEGQGTLALGGERLPFRGYGYFEHAWGIQPRQSTANWLHFWGRNLAGVVMDCHYDAGVPHAYTYLWKKPIGSYLAAPAHFSFDPAEPSAPWRILSPDLDLMAAPLHTHHMVMRMPPVLPYIDIDYHESIVELRGTAMVSGKRVKISAIGKHDFNFNRW